ncbi:MAG: hypothetical protein E7247_01755 [Paenibacillaceae bacterium]|nr:hypothetical protein [Paenibacillaceae bacterium]
MSKAKDTKKTVREPVKFNREALLASKEFSGYQPDFAKVLLTKTEYTLEEAKEILDKFFENKEEK